MEESINLSAETQEAAEPVNGTFEEESKEVSNLSAETQEAAEPVKETKTDSDRAFANMRRELLRKTAEVERMNNVIKKMGFNSEDEALAHMEGRSVEDIRRERTEKQKAEDERYALKEELMRYRQSEVKRRMEADLKAIQRLDPKVKSLDDLGGEYLSLIRSGISGETAYHAIKAKEAAHTKPAPPKIGKVNSRTAEESEFFSSKELDALTSKDLDDPVVYAKAMKSLSRLK